MKKVSLVVAMVLMVALALAGCAGGGNGGAAEGPISGEYKFDHALAGGQTVTADQLREAAGDQAASMLDMSFSFSGNKVTVKALGMSEESDYKLDGEVLTIEGQTMTYKDGQILMEQNGTTLVFTK